MYNLILETLNFISNTHNGTLKFVIQNLTIQTKPYNPLEIQFRRIV